MKIFHKIKMASEQLTTALMVAYGAESANEQRLEAYKVGL